MSVVDCVAVQKGSLIKARRMYMRVRKWRDVDWYAAWPGIADEWEKAAGEKR